jgi:ADP-heptose:LPS heptosyltransferase
MREFWSRLGLRKSRRGDPRLEVELISRADAARDEGEFLEAAALYRQALRLAPSLGHIHVQAGHMFKEAGELSKAEIHYGQALKLMPQDPDLALQLGHFNKVRGQLDKAQEFYARAVALDPNLEDAQTELQTLHDSGWRGAEHLRQAVAAQPLIRPEELRPEGRPDDLKLAALYGRLAPELAPRDLRELLRYSEESVAVRRFGVELNTFWGLKNVARGVEAIRGVVVSKTSVLHVEARVNGLPIHRGPLKGPYQLEYEPDKDRLHKYVFNIWYDFSGFAPGLYELELRLAASGGKGRLFSMEFVVEAPLLEADHPDSDGVITLANGGVALEEQVNARPSVIHHAERPNQLGEIRSVLVIRSDQLGDLVASIPAVLRLRELFPQAKLVGIFGPANVDLARTLKVFDELIVVDHAESWHQRTRTIPLLEQQQLRDRLAQYNFDLAIDLSQSFMSRPMLALSGAKFMHGFKDANWPRLSLSHDNVFFDAKNRRESASHSKRIMSLIEQLESLVCPAAQIIRRDDLNRERLERFGLRAGARFAVLHTGARIVFSRWAHFPELAVRLLEDTDLKVVLFTGDSELSNNLPPGLAGSDRLIILDGQLPFDDFDALLSYCAVFVGNDSGPKHLASLRGTPVVSIHSARVNWSEWGQEHTGVIVSRKVPCAGCNIYHDTDECGKDFACMNISLQEVYDAVRRYV